MSGRRRPHPSLTCIVLSRGECVGVMSPDAKAARDRSIFDLFAAALSIWVVVDHWRLGNFLGVAAFGAAGAWLTWAGVRGLRGRSAVPRTRLGYAVLYLIFLRAGLILVYYAVGDFRRGSTLSGVFGLLLGLPCLLLGIGGVVKVVRDPGN